MSLASCQERWAKALSDGVFDEAGMFVVSNGLAPRRRLWIYHNQLRLAWRDALETTYPATLALTGQRYFRRIARDYGRWYHAASGNLKDYGVAFPAYLDKRPELALYPYIPDVARLEWIRTESAAAAEDPGLPITVLADISEAVWPGLHMRLAASLRFLASAYPVACIFAAGSGHLHARAARASLRQQKAAALIVYRRGRAVTIETLTPAVWRWLLALADGRPLTEAVALACETATLTNITFDLRTALSWAFNRQLVIAIDP